MGKDVDQVQTQCEACQLAADRGKLCCIRQRILEKSIQAVLDRGYPAIKTWWKIQA